jgi:hypothetical protein
MLAVAALSSAVVPARSLAAQVPPPSPSPTATPGMLAPYRAPLIALVQPAGTAGGFVPQDRPVVVFRFAAGEADDPLDVRSLVVAVDGADRTVLFQTSASEAWGALADDEAVRRGKLAAGAHRVAARICSARGACGSTEAQVLVVPGLVTEKATAADESRRRRVLGAVLGIARRLIGQ